MSILNGFKKARKYLKTSGGYSLISQWTSSQTVEMDDGTVLENKITDIEAEIDKKAEIDSPTFTGTPKAPTASTWTDTTQIATTAFVQDAINNGIGIATSDAMTTNLLYIEPFYRIPPNGGMGFYNGVFSCSVTDENVTVWSGEIDLPEGGYAYPASSDSAYVFVTYTLDGMEHQVEISAGAVLPEGAAVTKYYLERKEGESRLSAVIYPMISPTKSPVSEFVSYTGDATKLNECLSDIVCPIYNTPANRANLKSGEKLNNAFGKISKFLSDLKTVAFSGSYNDLNNKPNAADIGALPVTGGTLTGDLRLKGDGNYGNKINFGDGDYVHISEPTDDCLEIKANKIDFVVPEPSGENFTLNGKKICGTSDSDGGYVLLSRIIYIPPGEPLPSTLGTQSFYVADDTTEVGPFEELVVVSINGRNGFSGLLWDWSYDGEAINYSVLKSDENSNEATIYYLAKD